MIQLFELLVSLDASPTEFIVADRTGFLLVEVGTEIFVEDWARALCEAAAAAKRSRDESA